MRPVTSREFLAQPPKEGQVFDNLMRNAIDAFWNEKVSDGKRRRKLHAWEAAELAVKNSGLRAGVLLGEMVQGLTITPDDVSKQISDPEFRDEKDWDSVLAGIATDALNMQMRTFPDIRNAHRKRIDRYER